jgi:hypothetical protein
VIPVVATQLSALMGDAQSHNPLLLASAYSSSGSVGVYMDKMGRIRTVDGWTRRAAAKTTDTGASAAIFRSLYMYRKIAAGVTTRQMLSVLDDGVNEVELYRSTDMGTTQTLIEDFGAASVGSIMNWAMFGDELYMANGVITPRYWDGTSLVNVGATQLVAPTLADGGAGPLNGSGFKYRLVPILANKQRKVGSVPSASLDVQNRRITVNWTADADVSVVGYELYRTSGSGLDFYLVIYIDGRTTVTYTDSLPDADLILKPALSVIAAHGDAPPITHYCVAHKGRMWWGRTSTNPRRWYWSDPGDADSVYQDRNYLELTVAGGDSTGDVTVGGTGEFNQSLILWCENSVWRVSGTGQVIGSAVDWRVVCSNARTGTVSIRAVAKIPDGASFVDAKGDPQRTSGNTLAFLSPQKDIRLFNGNDDTIISFPKADTLLRMNTAHQSKAYAYRDDLHGMFVWVFPIDASTECNYSVAWNYNFGTWHEWAGTNHAHVIVAEDSTEKNVLIAAESRIATGGLLYRLWSGDSQDGGTIEATLMTKPLYPAVEQDGGPDYLQEKRLEAVVLMFTKDAAPTTITVGLLAHDAADSDTPTISRPSTGTSRVRVPARKISTDNNPGQYFHGVGFRLKVSSNASSGPWILQGVTVTSQTLPGQVR